MTKVLEVFIRTIWMARIFHFENNQSKYEIKHIPADEIATQIIQYAREIYYFIF
jgi:hypothetical protein